MIKITVNYNRFIAVGAAEEPQLIEEFICNDINEVINIIKMIEQEKQTIRNIHFDYIESKNGEA